MYILSEPYVSDFLRDTILVTGAPVLDTPMARKVFEGLDHELLADDEFAALARRRGTRVYSNSENAIDWIMEHLADTDLPSRIRLFKDKVAFRELVRPLFPDYVFCEVAVADMDAVDVSDLPFPFVIKPAVGFFSVGVHVVESADAWPATVQRIRDEVARSAEFYPAAVLGLDRFIIEQAIEGEEFAVDAYFDENGEPVIVDIMGHIFAGADDVSDRVYYTSGDLIARLREPFVAFLAQVGELAGLRDFPVHAELRVNDAGDIVPIEINPMRFGGWCATDMAHYAFGINPYLTYLDDQRPEWDRILVDRRGTACGLVVADFAGDIDRSAIESVDYEAFQARFSAPLDMRRVDYSRFPVFAFLFAQVPAHDFSELKSVLHADLSGYLHMS